MIDPVIGHSWEGKEYPLASRDELLKQAIAIKKHFQRYDEFAGKSMAELFGQEVLNNAERMTAASFEHQIMVSQKEAFRSMALPSLTQAVHCFASLSLDLNGTAALLLAGNNLQVNSNLGYQDASLGELLVWASARQQVEMMPNSKTGIALVGQVRALHPLRLADGRTTILVVKNGDSPVLLLPNKRTIQEKIN